MDSKRKKLINITKESGAFKTGKFVLSSGKESNIYFDGRITSLLPESLEIISEILFEDIKKHSIDVIAGPTLGADAIVAGVLMIAAREKFKLKGAIVRKETKTHGTGKMVEGNYVEGDKVLVVDDTCTTGGSVLFAARIMEENKCVVTEIRCVLDRNEGGKQLIEGMGYGFSSILQVKNGKLI